MENIEEYVGYTESYLQRTPQFLFENQINQTLATLSQPIPTLAQQMSAWMMTIRSERKVLDFEMKKKTKELLKTITLDDVIEFYKKVGSGRDFLREIPRKIIDKKLHGILLRTVCLKNFIFFL